MERSADGGARTLALIGHGNPYSSPCRGLLVPQGARVRLYASVDLRLAGEAGAGDTLQHVLMLERADDEEPTFAFETPGRRPSLVDEHLFIAKRRFIHDLVRFPVPIAVVPRRDVLQIGYFDLGHSFG